MVSEGDANDAGSKSVGMVLILVIAVDGLGGQLYNSIYTEKQKVLILVIAVDGLGDNPLWVRRFQSLGLNPCYSGRWSRSIWVTTFDLFAIVLILVIAVDGLGEWIEGPKNIIKLS